MLSSAAELHITDEDSLTLLGSPLGNSDGVSVAISEKVDDLKIMGDRLQHLHVQDALLLLHHLFALPKLMYLLRTSPCFLSSKLQDYDDLLRESVSSITNNNLSVDDQVWIQATLPVKFGGLGIRSAVQLAPSAYLASAAGSSDLIPHILPSRFHICPPLFLNDALSIWSQGHEDPPPSGHVAEIVGFVQDQIYS